MTGNHIDYLPYKIISVELKLFKLAEFDLILVVLMQLSILYCIDNSYIFHSLFFVPHIFSTNPVPLLYCHYCV